MDSFCIFIGIFAGITAILAKCGLQKTDSNIAMAIRTIIVLLFSWGIVFCIGSQAEISSLTLKTWCFLILSGIAQVLHGFVILELFKTAPQVL